MFRRPTNATGGGVSAPGQKPKAPRLPRLALLLAGAFAAGVVLLPVLSHWSVDRLASRLEAETGLAWRIGGVSLGLSPTPGIRLDDIAIGDPAGRGLSAKLSQAAISGDLRALLGEDGELRADLSAVSARIPITGEDAAPTKGDPDDASGPHIAAIRALATGAELGFDASHTAVLSAPRAELAFRVAPSEKQRVDIELRAVHYVMKFGFETGGRATLASGAPATFSLAPPNGEEAWASGRCLFAASAKRLSFREMDGAANGAPFSGSATIELFRQPEANFDLHMRNLSIGANGDQRGDKGGALTGFDAAALGDFPVVAALQVDELRIGKLQAGEVKTRVTADNSGVDISLEAGRFYDGAARGRYTLTPDVEKPQHQLSLSIDIGRLAPFLAAAADTSALDGRATAHLDVQAAGATRRELVATARGTADVAIANGRIASAAISELADAPLISDIVAGDKGLLTSFRRFSGTFMIGGGKAASNDLRFESPLVSAPGRGAANLEAATIDFHFEPALLSNGARGGLKLPVHVSGPWKNPAVSANFDGVLNNPLAAVQSLEDIGEALFGGASGSDRPRTDKDGDFGRKRHRN